MHHDTHTSKKEAILKIASETIEQVGYQGLKIADLAKAASISMSTFYTHFASKEELYFAYISSKIDAVFHAVETFESNDPHLRLKHYICAAFTLAEQGKVLLTEGLKSNPLFFTAHDNEFSDNAKKLYDFLAECILDINPRLGAERAYRLGYGFNGQLHGYMQYWTVAGGDLGSMTEELHANLICMTATPSDAAVSGGVQ